MKLAEENLYRESVDLKQIFEARGSFISFYQCSFLLFSSSFFHTRINVCRLKGDRYIVEKTTKENSMH